MNSVVELEKNDMGFRLRKQCHRVYPKCCGRVEDILGIAVLEPEKVSLRRSPYGWLVYEC